MSYSVRYTISSLSGQYALKYSATIHHAERLEALLGMAKAAPCLDGFASGGPVRKYDGYDSFNALMKVLKYVMKRPERPFCTGVDAEVDGSPRTEAAFVDEDGEGTFEVRGLGAGLSMIRGDTTVAVEEAVGKKTTYHGHFEKIADLFKEDMMNLLNLCEEAMAKNSEIVATRVADDAPEAARLIQVPRH